MKHQKKNLPLYPAKAYTYRDIRAMRAKYRLSQTDLAAIAGVTLHRIQQIESGQHRFRRMQCIAWSAIEQFLEQTMNQQNQQME